MHIISILAAAAGMASLSSAANLVIGFDRWSSEFCEDAKFGMPYKKIKSEDPKDSCTNFNSPAFKSFQWRQVDGHKDVLTAKNCFLVAYSDKNCQGTTVEKRHLTPDMQSDCNTMSQGGQSLRLECHKKSDPPVVAGELIPVVVVPVPASTVKPVVDVAQEPSTKIKVVTRTLTLPADVETETQTQTLVSEEVEIETATVTQITTMTPAVTLQPKPRCSTVCDWDVTVPSPVFS